MKWESLRPWWYWYAVWHWCLWRQFPWPAWFYHGYYPRECSPIGLFVIADKLADTVFTAVMRTLVRCAPLCFFPFRTNVNRLRRQ
jgi:hypothetical protein